VSEYDLTKEIVDKSAKTATQEKPKEGGVSSVGLKIIEITQGVSNTEGESFSSFELIEDSLSNNFRISKKQRPPSRKAIRVLRTECSKQLISILIWFEENHSTENLSTAIYFNKLSRTIHDYVETTFHDPFSGFIMAMFDGLAHDHIWIETNKETYSKLAKMIKVISNQELDYKKVDKYIVKLNDIGLNVLPY